MHGLKKVTVPMTPTDLNNVAKIRKNFGSRSNREAFSTGASLAALTAPAAAQVDGQELIFRNPKTGECQQVVIVT